MGQDRSDNEGRRIITRLCYADAKKYREDRPLNQPSINADRQSRQPDSGIGHMQQTIYTVGRFKLKANVAGDPEHPAIVLLHGRPHDRSLYDPVLEPSGLQPPPSRQPRSACDPLRRPMRFTPARGAAPRHDPFLTIEPRLSVKSGFFRPHQPPLHRIPYSKACAPRGTLRAPRADSFPGGGNHLLSSATSTSLATPLWHRDTHGRSVRMRSCSS
jgi:hypothetical protein